MKKIKIEGKLNLNKETITKLNDEKMSNIKGGEKSIGHRICGSNLACNTTNKWSFGKECTLSDVCNDLDVRTRGFLCG